MNEDDDYENLVICRKCGEEFEDTNLCLPEKEVDCNCPRCQKDLEGQILFDFE
jgi:predicted Zn-ribbon and HTH transcriptional regulator